MKIQLKRSSVLENSAAKQPTPEQMEYGELAVNYNNGDPAIFLKDSANNIIRISGVGNISDDGQVEVPGTVNPPANPKDGNLWFNAEEGRLYVYYTDDNSSQWVDASPDNWQGANSIPDPDGPAQQPGTLDDRYVEKTGDNMTGFLTLGTDKIALDATTGAAAFSGNIDLTDSTVDLYSKTTNSESKTFQLFSDIGGTKTEKVYVNADGSATFSGGITSGGDQVLETGSINVYQSANSSSTVVFNGGYNLGSGRNITSTIFSDGSSSFSGDMEIEDASYFRLRATGSNDQTAIQLAPDGSVSFANGGFAVDGSGVIQTNIKSAGNIELDSSGTFSDPKITLKATDGSAEFAGGDLEIRDNGQIRSNSSILANTSAAMSDADIAFTVNHKRADGNSSAAYRVYVDGSVSIGDPTTGGTVDTNPLIKLEGSDGSADFSNTVKSGSSTRRGQFRADSPESISASAADCFVATHPSVGTSAQIKYDGSATFAGTVTAGSTSTGTQIFTNGSAIGRVSGAQKWYLNNNGSADFSGNITAAGYSMANLAQL